MSKSSIQIYKLAEYFRDRSGSTGLLIFTERPEQLKDNYQGNHLFVAGYVDPSVSLPEGTTLVSVEEIDSKFLADKILVCDSYLGDKLPFSNMARRIRRLQSQAVFSIVSVKKTGMWRSGMFNKFFKTSSLLGYGFDSLIAIGGKASDIRHTHYSDIPVLAIVPQYNEADIIEYVIGHLLEQGLDVHVIDDWSTDGSFEKVQELSQRYSKRVSVERFPKVAGDKYEWAKILDRVSEIAIANSDKYQWAMLNDADEIRWAPWSNITLQRAFSFIDHLGYSSVDFTLFNFEPTKDGFDGKESPLKFFRYGEFPTEGWAFLQIKAWKNKHKANLSSSGGHHVVIPNQMIYPLKFLLAHYPLRSSEQASRKVFKERKPRFTEEERAKNWSTHYDKINEKTTFIKSPHELQRFDKHFLDRHIIERVSGIGINLDDDSGA